MDPSKIQDVLS
jgi:hypothetical protein